jgi:hypothetical protein
MDLISSVLVWVKWVRGQIPGPHIVGMRTEQRYPTVSVAQLSELALLYGRMVFALQGELFCYMP